MSEDPNTDDVYELLYDVADLTDEERRVLQGIEAHMEYLLLKRWQRFWLWLIGDVYVGPRTHRGWRRAEPHYLVRCSRHGLYLDYPHGWGEVMRCQECMCEAAQRFKEAMG